MNISLIDGDRGACQTCCEGKVCCGLSKDIAGGPAVTRIGERKESRPGT